MRLREEDYFNFYFDGVVDDPVGNWSPFDGNIGNGMSELDNTAANGLERENNLPESESEDFYDSGESASYQMQGRKLHTDLLLMRESFMMLGNVMFLTFFLFVRWL